jgi:DNA-binding MarR family transcriptional regulator
MHTSEQFMQALRNWADVFHRRSTRDFILFAKRSGLSMTQFGTLMHLYHNRGCGVSDIAVHLGVTAAAASQMIERMVQQGLLERTEDPHDRRGKQLAITPEGSGLIKRGMDARTKWMDALGDSFNPEQQVAIAEALGLLASAAEQQDPGSPDLCSKPPHSRS